MDTKALAEYASRMKTLRDLRALKQSVRESGRANLVTADLAAVEQDIRRAERDLQPDFEAVSAFVDSISDAQTRIVFRLHYVNGLSWSETAEALNTTKGTVRAIAKRFLGSAHT